MNKRTIFFGLIFVLVVFLVVFLLVQQPKSNYAHDAEKAGVLFYSNEGEPISMVKQMASAKTFLISPKLSAQSKYASTIGNDFLIPFLVITTGNDKNGVSLLQIIDAQGNLLNCETNMGDVQTQINISKEECESLLFGSQPITSLTDTDAVKIILSQPNSALTKTQVIVSPNLIEINPNAYDSIKPATYAIIAEIFPNYKEVFQKSKFVSGLLVN